MVQILKQDFFATQNKFSNHLVTYTFIFFYIYK